jgi:type III pantothenate kinase
VLTSVNPKSSDRFAEWLVSRHQVPKILDRWQDLPLRIALEHPEWAGIDRLLNGVAARSRVAGGKAAVMVDAGSAVTVDYLDNSGAFQGGAIFPGLRLMAQALHDHTALLPVAPMPETVPVVPAGTTIMAVQAGIFWSAAGGIGAIVEQLGANHVELPQVFLTGGDALLLSPVMDHETILWPEMTLEGIRLTVEALP